MKDVKIIIGNNYGGEGKGLMTRYFALNAKNPIIILHNGSAQRGHTIDYSESFRHVYQHFGSGTGDNIPTYFAPTFFVHPMIYAEEFEALKRNFNMPQIYCDPNCYIITPFDMMVDQVTKTWSKKNDNTFMHDTAGLGTWCASEDRIPTGNSVYTAADFKKYDIEFLMNNIWNDCMRVLRERGVKIEELSDLESLFTEKAKQNAIKHFTKDLELFFKTTEFIAFDGIWKKFSSFIFEGGQGLGLDKNNDNIWHTSSNTGLINPYGLIKNKRNFKAEVCYVTRTYLTRHGDGPLENELNSSKKLNNNIIDNTNTFSILQGELRYGLIDNKLREQRIDKDYKIVKNNKKFSKTLAITHCNEYSADFAGDYYSDHKTRVHNAKDLL